MGSHGNNVATYLHPHFPCLGRSNLDVRDVEGLLGLPGHGGLAGDGLAVGGGQAVDEGRGHGADKVLGGGAEHFKGFITTLLQKLLTQYWLPICSGAAIT